MEEKKIENNQDESTEKLADSASDGNDGKFLALVCVLVITIMAMLTTLWLVERNRRVSVEEELAETRQTQEQAQAFGQKIMGMPPEMLMNLARTKKPTATSNQTSPANSASPSNPSNSSNPSRMSNPDNQPSPRPLNREDLPSTTITIDGKNTTAFKISPTAGKRFGFLPQDIIIVSPETNPPAPAK